MVAHVAHMQGSLPKPCNESSGATVCGIAFGRLVQLPIEGEHRLLAYGGGIEVGCTVTMCCCRLCDRAAELTPCKLCTLTTLLAMSIKYAKEYLGRVAIQVLGDPERLILSYRVPRVISRVG